MKSNHWELTAVVWLLNTDCVSFWFRSRRKCCWNSRRWTRETSSTSPLWLWKNHLLLRRKWWPTPAAAPAARWVQQHVLKKKKKIAEYVFPGIKRCNVVKVLFYLRVLPQLLLLSGILSVFVVVLCSPCCSTPLHSMTRWRRSLMFLTTPLLSCQTTLKGFWSRCWRNLQRRWWMSPRSPSLMRRAQPASQSQAAPPPVWCMDPTTTSTKVGQSFCVTAAHQSAEVDFQLTETLKDVLWVWPSKKCRSLFVLVVSAVFSSLIVSVLTQTFSSCSSSSWRLPADVPASCECSLSAAWIRQLGGQSWHHHCNSGGDRGTHGHRGQ